MLGRQYFIDRDGYPVLTTDGHPVHIVVDEDTVPVLDEPRRPNNPRGLTLPTLGLAAVQRPRGRSGHRPHGSGLIGSTMVAPEAGDP
jgi:hypothetical protein